MEMAVLEPDGRPIAHSSIRAAISILLLSWRRGPDTIIDIYHSTGQGIIDPP